MTELTNDAAVFPFEEIGPDLPLLPLAARRALDHAGLRLPLEGWRSLALVERQKVVAAGAAAVVPLEEVREAVAKASPPPVSTTPTRDPEPPALPAAIVDLLAGRPLDLATWLRLGHLGRFALVHTHRRAVERDDPMRLERVYDALVAPLLSKGPSPEVLSFTHLTPAGAVHMVDVGGKPVTARRAVASGAVLMSPATAERLARREAPKGEVLATARVAGIFAAKRTPELIPLCHTIALSHVEIDLDVDTARGRVDVTATVETVDRTGVEMEALTAVSVACLTIYDMLKSADRAMVITDVKLLEKEGGRSGHFVRAEVER